jgi:CRISPR type IV-associated protein Csf3
MEPLRVECRLAGPWSPPAHGVHLDGRIARAVVREALRTDRVPESAAESDGREYANLIADLPFEKYESENGWCWKASKFELIGYLGQERRYLSAKTPVTAMARAIGDGIVEAKGGAVIDTQRGIGKNSSLFYTLEHGDELHAWCIADRDALESLLVEVTSIGIKTRLGHGALMPYEDGKLFKVVPDEAARTKWQNRNLPDKLQENMFPGVGALRSPYWKEKVYCWMPMPA